MFLFAVSFTVMIGVMWEISEYLFDEFLQTNTQNALGLFGREAVLDTMHDLICDTVGGVIGASILVSRMKKNGEDNPQQKRIFTSIN